MFSESRNCKRLEAVASDSWRLSLSRVLAGNRMWVGGREVAAGLWTNMGVRIAMGDASKKRLDFGS